MTPTPGEIRSGVVDRHGTGHLLGTLFVAVAGMPLPVPVPGPAEMPLRGARVQVRRLADGSWRLAGGAR